MEIIDDFASMKVEIERLRRRLDTQELINDRVLRQAVKQATSFSRRFLRIEIMAMVPIAILGVLNICVRFDLPWWFMVVSVIMLGGCLIADLVINRIMNVDFGTVPLVEMEERLLRQKRMRAMRVVVGLTCIVPWLICMCQLMKSSDVFVDKYGSSDIMIYGLVVGALVGAVIGLVIFFRMQRSNEAALSRLRSFKETDA